MINLFSNSIYFHSIMGVNKIYLEDSIKNN